MNDNILLIAILILFLLGLRIFRFVKLKKDIQKEEIKITNKKHLIKNVTDEKIKLKIDFYKKLSSICGEEISNKISNRELWKGMSSQLLIALYERYPDNVEKTTNPETKFETYFYNEIENVRSNARRKYYHEIFLENGIVTWWDIKN